MRTRSRRVTPFAVLLVLGLACTPQPPEGLTEPPSGEPATFSVTLAWDPPTTDATGAPLTDLASYRLYYGQATPVTRDNAAMVEVGSDATFTVDGLTAGVWFFAVSALDTEGNESELSGEISAELRAR